MPSPFGPMSIPMPAPVPPSPPGLRARIQHWFVVRMPRRDSMQLMQRNLYILPTGAGALLMVTLLALLVASINYQLNLGYLLTFLIAGCAVVSVPITHNTLRGLHLHLQPPQPQFADKPVLLNIRLHNPQNRRRPGIGLRVQDIHAPASAKQGFDALDWHDCPALAEHTVQLAWHCGQRGWHALPALHIETRFPLGIFRAWSVWRMASHVLLYPAPEAHPPPLPLQGSSPQQHPTPRAQHAVPVRSDEVPEDIRPYQRGDSPRHIVWKKVAQTGELVSRESRRPDSRALWLDFDAAAPQRGTEAALQRLCAWVQTASQQGQRFGLRLPPTAARPETTLGPDQGSAHTQHCLQALAEWGLSRPMQPANTPTQHSSGHSGLAQNTKI